MIAVYESKIQARRIAENRLVGLEPGEQSLGWDVEESFDPEGSGWSARVHENIPRIEEDEIVLLRRLEKKLDDNASDIDGLPRGKTRKKDIGQRQTTALESGGGTGGNEVETEAEEGGVVGPSEWERERIGDDERHIHK